jgi:hypothetical protein
MPFHSSVSVKITSGTCNFEGGDFQICLYFNPTSVFHKKKCSDFFFFYLSIHAFHVHENNPYQTGS